MQKVLNEGYLGKNIQRLRIAKGFSQEGLVAQLNLLGSSISRTTLSKIERGIGNVKESDLRLLKSALEVDYAAFFEAFD